MVNLDRNIDGVLAASTPALVVVADTVWTVTGKRAPAQGVNMVGQGKRIHKEHRSRVEAIGRNGRCHAAVGVEELCTRKQAVRRAGGGGGVVDTAGNDVGIFAEVPLAH